MTLIAYMPDLRFHGAIIAVCFAFLFLTAVTTVFYLILLIACIFKKSLRPQIRSALLSILVSVLLFFTAAAILFHLSASV